MSDPKPCIICVAITGSLPTKASNPAVPITLAEHRERLAERFRKQDVDRDGFLSARELSAPPR